MTRLQRAVVTSIASQLSWLQLIPEQFSAIRPVAAELPSPHFLCTLANKNTVNVPPSESMTWTELGALPDNVGVNLTALYEPLQCQGGTQGVYMAWKDGIIHHYFWLGVKFEYDGNWSYCTDTNVLYIGTFGIKPGDPGIWDHYKCTEVTPGR